MTTQQQYARASMKTADDLHTIAASAPLRSVSTLSLPEIEAAVDAVARVVPAGNVPGMILSGLARLPGRRLPAETARRDVNLLFRGVEAALDKAVYGAFFAGPAAVIWGYQNLLKLAGKSPKEAFPEGLWQFYADYALREDTARFTLETHGFDTVLRHHQIELSPRKRVAAWIMAAIHCLHQYDALLANEWRERVYTATLQAIVSDTPEAEQFSRLYREWQNQRPFGRKKDAARHETYPAYRRRCFDRCLRRILDRLDEQTRYEWNQRIQEAKENLPAYQQQMSILAYLEPTTYGETRQPIALRDACIGLIYQGRYYLIPACLPQSETPPPADVVAAQVAAIMGQPTAPAAMRLSALATLPRQDWATLRPDLNPTLLKSLERLRSAPIIINADQQSPHLPLTEIRRAERGVGGHPLTIFDAQTTFVFDCSHIFFDGAWSAALAEILTREALAWAVYLQEQPVPDDREGPMIQPLPLPFEQQESLFIRKADTVAVEVSVETTAVQLKPILTLRQLFKRRNDLLQLTVNDVLVLYRAIHAITYRPDPKLAASLEALAQEPKLETAVSQALDAMTTTNQNPAILIPVDASKQNPKERIYPLVFAAPLHELDLLGLHRQTVAAQEAYREASPEERQETYSVFDPLQRQYLATLAGFGQVLAKAKAIAKQGESASQGAVRLLGHVPVPLQRLLDQIPNRFDVLNDLLKGREVFSDVGAVAPDSSLSRFSTAKDDNEKKTLAWGVLTDAEGTMHVSLRDFRPHVASLIDAGHRQVAREIAHHYLDTYAHGLNGYVNELIGVTRTSRETKIMPPP